MEDVLGWPLLGFGVHSVGFGIHSVDSAVTGVGVTGVRVRVRVTDVRESTKSTELYSPGIVLE